MPQLTACFWLLLNCWLALLLPTTANQDVVFCVLCLQKLPVKCIQMYFFFFCKNVKLLCFSLGSHCLNRPWIQPLVMVSCCYPSTEIRWFYSDMDTCQFLNLSVGRHRLFLYLGYYKQCHNQAGMQACLREKVTPHPDIYSGPRVILFINS